MADRVSQQIEKAPNMIVNFTEKCGKVKKELKKSINETASNLNNLIFFLKNNLLEKTEENNKVRNEVKQLKYTLEKTMSTSSVRLVALSVSSNTGKSSCVTAVFVPPCGSKKNLFSEAMCGTNAERHKLTVKPKVNQSTEEIKKLIKAEVNPVNKEIGIRTFKSLKNGNFLIDKIVRKRLKF
jgi:hypothetical protein